MSCIKGLNRKGSITILGCLTMFLVGQVLCVLLEASRMAELHKVGNLEVAELLESAFASYNAPLWQEFRLLAWDETAVDLDEMGAQMTDMYADTSGTNMLRANMLDGGEIKRLLMTDQNGRIYEKAVTCYMKENWVAEIVDRYREDYDNISKLEEESQGSMDYYLAQVREALQILSDVGKDKGGGHSIQYIPDGSSRITNCATEEDQEKINSFGNPLSMMESTFKNGISGFIITDATTISANKLSKDQLLSNRSLRKGNLESEDSLQIMDRFLFLEYIFGRFGNYREDKENRPLLYEWEYLINGFPDDRSNLNAVIAELLVIREAANLTSLYKDAQKTNEIKLYSNALALLIGQPEVEPVFRIAMMIAWAYAESILDLRSLFEGEQIPLFKSSSEWTTAEFLISPAYFLSGEKAKECNHGMKYEDYLKAILFGVSDEKLSFRAMDLQEQTIRGMEGYENFRMDNLVCAVELTKDFEAEFMFLPLVEVVKGKAKGCKFSCKETYSFLEKK